MSKFDQLTEAQREVAQILVDNELLPKDERREIQDIADEFNVHRKTIWHWRRRNPLFAEYKQHLTTLALQDSHTALAKVLIDNLTKSQPSTKMLDLMAKMTPNVLAANRSEIEVTSASDSQEDVIKRIQELEKLKAESSDGE
jgi:predicted DNA-binding protein YlxM (UPF0122 family)